MEVLDVCRHRISSIALGIDGDECYIDPLGVLAQSLKPACNISQGRRTNIGAIRKAEKHEQRLPDPVRWLNSVAFVIGQREVDLTDWKGQLAFTSFSLQRTGAVNLPPAEHE